MSAPVNAVRGEVALTINDRPYTLCLTLGALAQLETAMNVSSPADVAGRLAALSSTDMLMVLSALTAGGGCAMSVDELSIARIDPRAAASAVAAAFAAVAQREA